MLLPSHLLLLLWVGTVNGFWPNHESGGIRKSDFTDADITELGALQAVAHFMEKNPLPGQSPAAPGELEHMVPLTVTRLFKAYYKGKAEAEGEGKQGLPLLHWLKCATLTGKPNQLSTFSSW